MSDELSKFIKIPYTRTKANDEIICCTTCYFTSREFNRYNELRFRKCEIINHTNYYNFYKDACDDSQKFQICIYCVKSFKNSICRCNETLYDLCNTCNHSACQYIQGKSHCQCDNCSEIWPRLCEDHIYHRYCECVYHTLAEYTEVEYDKKMGDDYFNPEKFHNTYLFNCHRKKVSNKLDNWRQESRRIRLIEPCSTKPGSQGFDFHKFEDWDPSNVYCQKRYLNQCKKHIQKLYFKCEHCSNNALFESSDEEYLCYECNDKIDSKIQKTIENKKSKASKFNHKKYKTEYEHNDVCKSRKKSFTKKFLQDYDDSDYKTFSNRRETISVRPKKVEQVVSQQTIAPFWNERLYSNSWVGKTAMKYCDMNKNKYEKSFPKLPSFTCSVCYEDSGHRTKCNHFVCKSCLDRWSITKNTCPICRDNL